MAEKNIPFFEILYEFSNSSKFVPDRKKNNNKKKNSQQQQQQQLKQREKKRHTQTNLDYGQSLSQFLGLFQFLVFAPLLMTKRKQNKIIIIIIKKKHRRHIVNCF